MAPADKRDDVPKNKRFRFSTRDNSDYKWQRARGVVGVLEVHCEPFLEVRDDLVPRNVAGSEAVFAEGLKLWDELRLRDRLVETCENTPPEMCCCGIVKDDDATIKELVPQLNEGFVKHANKLLADKGFKLDCFLWNWQNASGKAETNIILIRFFELMTNRLRRASDDEFDMLNLELGSVASMDSAEADMAHRKKKSTPEKQETAKH